MNTTTKNETAQGVRLREFGAFLRSRRERLNPSAVGLPEGSRRRTPGLRREEVAVLAGVGTTWYTWLEQGRDVNPSAEALFRVAQALRLDSIERQHLFNLANRPQPVTRATGPECIPESLSRMLAGLTGQPAMVVGRRWDILSWNRAAQALFGDYSQLPSDERNILHMVFANEEHRRLLVDWENVARVTLAMFRADTARYAGDTEFERLIAKVTRLSPEFRGWWPHQDVLHKLASPKRIRHPLCGLMTFETVSLALQDSSDMKLILYTPLEQDDTIAKLEALLLGSR
ncbi:MAG: helix-turn-helix transcriptional regulator [Terriglobia bacterium]